MLRLAASTLFTLPVTSSAMTPPTATISTAIPTSIRFMGSPPGYGVSELSTRTKAAPKPHWASESLADFLPARQRHRAAVVRLVAVWISYRGVNLLSLERPVLRVNPDPALVPDDDLIARVAG